jgi:hypothetical protein
MTANSANAITWWAVASAFGGTIIGGIISTFVAFIIQQRSFEATKRQRAEDRHEARKALAYSMFFKMIRIHSSIVLLGKGNRESIAAAEANGVAGDYWQKVIPHGNLPPRVTFTADEMALLLSLDFNIFNEIAAYDDIHNSLVDLFAEYARRRVAVMERFGAKMSGSTGTTSLTREEAEWLAPRAHELNSLAKAMLDRAEADSKESRDLLLKLHSLFVKHFGLNPKLEFKEPT